MIGMETVLSAAFIFYKKKKTGDNSANLSNEVVKTLNGRIRVQPFFRGPDLFIFIGRDLIYHINSAFPYCIFAMPVRSRCTSRKRFRQEVIYNEQSY